VAVRAVEEDEVRLVVDGVVRCGVAEEADLAVPEGEGLGEAAREVEVALAVDVVRRGDEGEVAVRSAASEGGREDTEYFRLASLGWTCLRRLEVLACCLSKNIRSYTEYMDRNRAPHGCYVHLAYGHKNETSSMVMS
jgi:hypothetical protein